jgi:hypothetical protein
MNFALRRSGRCCSTGNRNGSIAALKDREGGIDIRSEARVEVATKTSGGGSGL